MPLGEGECDQIRSGMDRLMQAQQTAIDCNLALETHSYALKYREIRKIQIFGWVSPAVLLGSVMLVPLTGMGGVFGMFDLIVYLAMFVGLVGTVVLLPLASVFGTIRRKKLRRMLFAFDAEYGAREYPWVGAQRSVRRVVTICVRISRADKIGQKGDRNVCQLDCKFVIRCMTRCGRGGSAKSDLASFSKKSSEGSRNCDRSIYQIRTSASQIPVSRRKTYRPDGFVRRYYSDDHTADARCW